MVLIPTPVPIPTPAPDGSVGSDVGYAIPVSNLALLSTDTKSTLLAVSNLGSSITSRINSTLDLILALGDFEAYVVDASSLDGLSDGSLSSALSVSNVGTSSAVRIVVILGEITPGVTPTVWITDMTTTYEVSIPTTTSEKRVEFDNIPSSFVSSFYVQNNTGTTLASWGNSIVVVGL